MTDQAAREELWISFRSLLHAYLAAATMGAAVPQALLHDLPQGRLQIVSTRHIVTLELSTQTGEGYWKISGQPQGGDAALDEGSFRLHLDGQMEWSGKPGRFEMEQFAEALATLIIS